MKKFFILCLVITLLLATAAANAYFYPELSGDAVYGDGADTINVNERFRIDIYFNLYYMYTGLITPFVLYGTGDVTALSYQDADLGELFDSLIFVPPLSIYYESWDGNLPDRFGVSALILSGIYNMGHYMSVDLEISGDASTTGLFCIDSADMDNDEYDWLFSPPQDFYEACWPVYKFPDICGDVNTDGPVNILDIAKLGAILYMGEPPIHDMYKADVNHDCVINILDVTRLIDYIYYNGPPIDCPDNWPCR